MHPRNPKAIESNRVRINIEIAATLADAQKLFNNNPVDRYSRTAMIKAITKFHTDCNVLSEIDKLYRNAIDAKNTPDAVSIDAYFFNILLQTAKKLREKALQKKQKDYLDKVDNFIDEVIETIIEMEKKNTDQIHYTDPLTRAFLINIAHARYQTAHEKYQDEDKRLAYQKQQSQFTYMIYRKTQEKNARVTMEEVYEAMSKIAGDLKDRELANELLTKATQFIKSSHRSLACVDQNTTPFAMTCVALINAAGQNGWKDLAVNVETSYHQDVVPRALRPTQRWQKIQQNSSFICNAMIRAAGKNNGWIDLAESAYERAKQRKVINKIIYKTMLEAAAKQTANPQLCDDHRKRWTILALNVLRTLAAKNVTSEEVDSHMLFDILRDALFIANTANPMSLLDLENRELKQLVDTIAKRTNIAYERLECALKNCDAQHTHEQDDSVAAEEKSEEETQETHVPTNNGPSHTKSDNSNPHDDADQDISDLLSMLGSVSQRRLPIAVGAHPLKPTRSYCLFGTDRQVPFVPCADPLDPSPTISPLHY